MKTLRCKLNCKHGLHARPSAFIAGLCKCQPGGWPMFPQTEFRILRGPKKDPPEVNPKSIIELMSAGFEQGEEVTLEVRGKCEIRAAGFLREGWENLGNYPNEGQGGKPSPARWMNGRSGGISDPDIIGKG